jgi:peptidoglycan/LPS O-acetylase OafA/YrhL
MVRDIRCTDIRGAKEMSATIEPSATLHEAPPSSPSAAKPRLRLQFLDGLRGLSALYVAIYHVCHSRAAMSPIWVHATNWTRFGHYGVDVFIVLSGYCLMMPVARAADGRMRKGSLDFFRRRARRLLPTYYAALAATLLLIVISCRMKHSHGFVDGEGLPVFAAGNLLSHVLLYYNVTRWCGSINGVLWSVATEWQIYFFFPFFLLPIWRRFGAWTAIVAGFALGLVPHYALPQAYRADQAYLWLLGLFALGMAGASLVHSVRESDQRLRDRVPWGVLAIVLSAAFWATITLLPARWRSVLGWETDALMGAATFSFVVYCACCATHPHGHRPAILRLLENRWTVLLGGFSYSLYLMHLPIEWMWQPLTRKLHIFGNALYAFEWLVALPSAVMVSYLFYLAVERHFVNNSEPTKTISSAAS